MLNTQLKFHFPFSFFWYFEIILTNATIDKINRLNQTLCNPVIIKYQLFHFILHYSKLLLLKIFENTHCYRCCFLVGIHIHLNTFVSSMISNALNTVKSLPL